MKFDLSPQSWGRVVVFTVAGTLACVVTTLCVDSFNFAGMDGARLLRALTIDILLPIFLAVPLLLFFTNKLRELAIAHQRLTIYASTDSLTQVMNRAAFCTLVEHYLTDVRSKDLRYRGALLIIDVDNFKAVNDHYGHDRGDEALVLIAQSIRSPLRAPQVVGRLGGEEFGVFLPGVGAEEAARVAERVRQSVAGARFAPAGLAYRLSVSVGVAAFDRPLGFADLFRIADQQLYVAKREGRNRVALSHASSTDALAA